MSGDVRLRHELPLPSAWDEVVTLTRPARSAGRLSYPGVRFRTAAVPPGHRTRVFGLPALTVARTVLDIARTDGVAAGLVVADVALRPGRRHRQAGRAVTAGSRPVRSATAGPLR